MQSDDTAIEDSLQSLLIYVVVMMGTAPLDSLLCPCLFESFRGGLGRRFLLVTKL